jgi:hypothetical protein
MQIPFISGGKKSSFLSEKLTKSDKIWAIDLKNSFNGGNGNICVQNVLNSNEFITKTQRKCRERHSPAARLRLHTLIPICPLSQIRMAENTGKPGGYNIQFVKDPDVRLKCPLCKLPLRSPFQTSCGHRYCESCIKDVINK